MNKKNIVLILKTIPLFSAVISFILIILNHDSNIIRNIIMITTLLAFLGFVFFFIGRKLGKENKTVRILGILDWLATIYVIVLYTIAILSFGL